jgi:hypothetical protein
MGLLLGREENEKQSGEVVSPEKEGLRKYVYNTSQNRYSGRREDNRRVA